MVPLFNHLPGTLDVMVYPQTVEPNVATTLNITVEDDGDPVAGALICVMKSDNDTYLTDYTEANGDCQFQLPALSIPGSIDVTITKYNYRPYEATIQVSEFACYGILNLSINNQTLSTTETFEACETITAGPAVNVTSTGDVTFQVGNRVILKSGFSVEDGGRLSVIIDASAGRLP